MRQLDTPCSEKGIGGDKEGIRALTLHTFERSTDLTAGAGVENLDLQAHDASSGCYLSQCPFRLGRARRINQYRDTLSLGQQLAQEFQPLCCQLGREESNAGGVAARPSEVRNEANSHRVLTGQKHDGDRRRCRPGCEYRRYASRSDYGNLTMNKISRQHWQSIKLILGPAVFYRHVLAHDVASLLQALAECPQPFRNRIRRSRVEIPDHRHRRLLRARHERPRCRRAAEQRYELATPHSITSSAVICMINGTVRPRALAVLRLMIRSNLVGCSTGKSAGLAPLRILPI